MVRHGDEYFTCCTGARGRLEVWRSASLLERGTCAVVWTPPRCGWNRAEVWAPEIHFLQGHWYLYYAASNGRNENHRMGVLRSVTDDPQGEFQNLGQMYTGDDIAGRTDNRWAIDGTPLELNGNLYFAWSGWEDRRDIQHLYIARMSDPATICSNRVRMAPNNCHAWEHVGETRCQRGLHEGPAFLHRHGRVFCVYSCSGSVGAHLQARPAQHGRARADPLDPASWTKHPSPDHAVDRRTSTASATARSRPASTAARTGSCSTARRASGTAGREAYMPNVSAGRKAGLPDFGHPLKAGERMPTPSRASTVPARTRAA